MTHFLAPWPHVSMTNVIDILLVAIVIYQFLMLVRGTRAAPMLVGVAAVGLGFYIARIGELTTLSWLVSTLVPYVIFALIVVFQAEIRHALANLGSSAHAKPRVELGIRCLRRYRPRGQSFLAEPDGGADRD